MRLFMLILAQYLILITVVVIVNSNNNSSINQFTITKNICVPLPRTQTYSYSAIKCILFINIFRDNTGVFEALCLKCEHFMQSVKRSWRSH